MVYRTSSRDPLALPGVVPVLVGVVVGMPKRIQLSRKKGWRLPQNTVVVDRRTGFGNPSACTHPHNCSSQQCQCCPESEYCCIKVFREYVLSGVEDRPARNATFNILLDAEAGYPYRNDLVRRLPELRGKDLACWCPLDKPCHADVLLELANQ